MNGNSSIGSWSCPQLDLVQDVCAFAEHQPCKPRFGRCHEPLQGIFFASMTTAMLSYVFGVCRWQHRIVAQHIVRITRDYPPSTGNLSDNRVFAPQDMNLTVRLLWLASNRSKTTMPISVLDRASQDSRFQNLALRILLSKESKTILVLFIH
jgi:hypothetical protein